MKQALVSSTVQGGGKRRVDGITPPGGNEKRSFHKHHRRRPNLRGRRSGGGATGSASASRGTRSVGKAGVPNSPRVITSPSPASPNERCGKGIWDASALSRHDDGLVLAQGGHRLRVQV